MSDAKSALRMFLVSEAGGETKDFTVFLGESIELAMAVYGLASCGTLTSANCNHGPGFAARSVSKPELRKAT